MPPLPGKIILLNGASSAGKSTLAAALQAKLDEPFWHISIDHLIAAGVLPQERIDSGEFAWQHMREPFFDGFHRCIPALARAGNNLIVEDIVETGDWMHRLMNLLAGLDVFFVGIHCPLDELERRERARANRRIGEARADYENTHTFGTYDLEVDSTVPMKRNVDELLAAWRARARPSVFERMARELATTPHAR